MKPDRAQRIRNAAGDISRRKNRKVPGDGQAELLPAPAVNLELRREWCKMAMQRRLTMDWPDKWFAKTYKLTVEEVKEIRNAI